jgi:predicted MPP superfamily phosphohydrolase
MSKLRGEPWTTENQTAGQSTSSGYYTAAARGIKKPKSLQRHAGGPTTGARRAYAGDGMLLHQDDQPTSTAADADNAAEQWIDVRPGLRRLVTPRGSWFQYKDAAGFEWNTYELAIPHLPAGLNGFRILQVADVHCWKQWQRAYDELIERVRADEPDLMLFTGDMVDDIWKPLPALPTARRLLNSLRAKLGLFGVRGNHDMKVRPASLTGTPLKLIDGQRVVLETGSGEVELIGLPGPEREDLSDAFLRSLPPKQPGVPRIMVSHYPDHIRRIEPLGPEIGPDVYLAGHTHGGQVCLPGGIPILRHDSLPQELCRGVHRLAHCWFVVSRGLGFSGYRFRVFCPAEVVELRLVSSLS